MPYVAGEAYIFKGFEDKMLEDKLCPVIHVIDLALLLITGPETIEFPLTPMPVPTPDVTVVWLPVWFPPPNLVILCWEAPFNLVIDLWRTSFVGSKLAAPELLFAELSPELPLPIGRFSLVMLLCDVGKRPVDREEADPTAAAELIVVPTAFDAELDGTIPTPILPKIAFWATTLLRWIFARFRWSMFVPAVHQSSVHWLYNTDCTVWLYLAVCAAECLISSDPVACSDCFYVLQWSKSSTNINIWWILSQYEAPKWCSFIFLLLQSRVSSQLSSLVLSSPVSSLRPGWTDWEGASAPVSVGEKSFRMRAEALWAAGNGRLMRPRSKPIAAALKWNILDL